MKTENRQVVRTRHGEYMEYVDLTVPAYTPIMRLGAWTEWKSGAETVVRAHRRVTKGGEPRSQFKLHLGNYAYVLKEGAGGEV